MLFCSQLSCYPITLFYVALCGFNEGVGSKGPLWNFEMMHSRCMGGNGRNNLRNDKSPGTLSGIFCLPLVPAKLLLHCCLPSVCNFQLGVYSMRSYTLHALFLYAMVPYRFLFSLFLLECYLAISYAHRFLHPLLYCGGIMMMLIFGPFGSASLLIAAFTSYG